MRRVIIVPVFHLLVMLLALTAAPFATVAADRFDISYVWSGDLTAVQHYRKQVAGVLGPGVAKDLKVVSNGKLYGVVYERRGDSTGATRVAKSHTRLLRARGLDAASPMPSGNWTLVNAAEPKRASVTSPTAPGERSSKMTAGAAALHRAPSASTSMAATHARSREIHDIEAAVKDYINRLRQQGKLAPDERTGWSVYDFTTGEKLVTINEDEQFQTASMVKPFVAAAYFSRVKQGKLVYGSKSRRQMERMIQHSNNASTNWVMRQVGGPRAVERILKQQYPAIFQDIQLVEYIPAGGRTYRNKASVHDYSRFLYALWKDEIAGARELKRLMALPGPDRIYMGVRDVPRGTKVYNKTGSTARLCADMGILSVEGPDGRRYPYTLIGIIEKEQNASDYTTWIRSRGNIIRNVSSIVYKGIAEDHDI
jgi:beta-lactamase class A